VAATVRARATKARMRWASRNGDGAVTEEKDTLNQDNGYGAPPSGALKP